MTTPPKRHADEVDVDEHLVRRLLRDQFPQWADLPLRVVVPTGTDHTVYRLGDELVVRMPVMAYATRQAAKEARWVPFLASQVPLQLPLPVGMGEPGQGYPLSWSVVRWIAGEQGSRDTLDLPQAAADLAAFVRALHACDASGGPPAGADTGWRGRPLGLWVERLEPWIEQLDGFPGIDSVLAAWREALSAPEWDRPAVWFHGDLAGNLIARDRRLVGVIDSGYGVGDPACDLMPGWTLFHGESRRVFFEECGLDDATILRARGWAIAPSLIGLSYYRDVPHLQQSARGAIESALAD
jgi:aminoglycoside phosphotransferase (APT) family kinase protein